MMCNSHGTPRTTYGEQVRGEDVFGNPYGTSSALMTKNGKPEFKGYLTFALVEWSLDVQRGKRCSYCGKLFTNIGDENGNETSVGKEN